MPFGLNQQPTILMPTSETRYDYISRHELFHGPYGSYWDGDIIAYNAHVHPSLRAGDRWTLSYNVNSMDSRVAEDADHYRDPGIYKPRFVSFRIVAS